MNFYHITSRKMVLRHLNILMIIYFLHAHLLDILANYTLKISKNKPFKKPAHAHAIIKQLSCLTFSLLYFTFPTYLPFVYHISCISLRSLSDLFYNKKPIITIFIKVNAITIFDILQLLF